MQQWFPLVMTAVALVALWWFKRSISVVTRQQVFAALVGFFSATAVMGIPSNHMNGFTLWFYFSAIVATISLTWLMVMWFKRVRLV